MVFRVIELTNESFWNIKESAINHMRNRMERVL